jgi:hypothetical protein
MRATRNARAALVVGVVLLLAIAAVTLTRAPPRVVRADAQEKPAGIGYFRGDSVVCQENEVLPAGVTGIRLLMRAFFGAPVHVVVYGRSGVLTEGARGANWTGTSVTVPVKPMAQASTEVRLCFSIGPNAESVVLVGDPASPQEIPSEVLDSPTPTARSAASEEQPLEGRVGVEYLAPGRGSWWSRLPSVAMHVGLGRAFSGTWIAFLVGALMAAVGVLAVRLAARELP